MDARTYAAHARRANDHHGEVTAAYLAAFRPLFVRQWGRIERRLAAIRRSAVADVGVRPGDDVARDPDPDVPAIRAQSLYLDGFAEDLGGSLRPAISRQTAIIGGILLGAAWSSNPLSDHIADRQAQRLAYVGDAVVERSDRVLRDMAGQSFDALTEKLGQLWDGFAGWYADRIAGDEASCTISGSITAGAAWGAVDGVTRVWRTEDDDRVRPTHDDAEGQTVAVDEQFAVGADMLWYPGDPDGSIEETINCRCRIEILGADGEPMTDPAADDEALANEIDAADQSGVLN